MCCSGRSQTDARGAYAAEGGQLDVLQWARANGCPWDGSTCAGAAEGGHLDVLQWARANGCPWNETTCEYAVKGGKFELYKWARKWLHVDREMAHLERNAEWTPSLSEVD